MICGDSKRSPLTLPPEHHETLVAKVEQQGLLKRTYKEYFLVTGVALAGMGGCLYALTLSDAVLFQVVNAIAFGFFCVQLGIVSHDLSHGQVMCSRAANRYLAMVTWGLFLGLSESNWFRSHNIHHTCPNHLGHDPALDIPFAFSQAQAMSKSDFFKKWMLPNQHILFWIGLSLAYPVTVLMDMRFLFKKLSFTSVIEMFFMALHFVLLLGLTFYFLPIHLAIIFLAVTFGVAGLYMGCIFAPNHKGEAMLDAHDKFNWVYQIVFTRNIRSTWLTSYLLGGLGNQIEHHLFPTMSRFQYYKAQKIVLAFCAQHAVPYNQVSWLESSRAIYDSLKRESEVAPRNRTAG